MYYWLTKLIFRKYRPTLVCTSSDQLLVLLGPLLGTHAESPSLVSVSCTGWLVLQTGFSFCGLKGISSRCKLSRTLALWLDLLLSAKCQTGSWTTLCMSSRSKKLICTIKDCSISSRKQRSTYLCLCFNTSSFSVCSYNVNPLKQEMQTILYTLMPRFSGIKYFPSKV